MGQFGTDNKYGEMTELAYLAGLFDGEGSVSILLLKGKKRIIPLHVLSCVLAMTHEVAVRLFFDRFGGDVSLPMVRDRANHSQTWRWRVQGQTARDFLQEIVSYLIVKQPQAQLGIEFAAAKKRYWRLPVEELATREKFRDKMCRLNSRGSRRVHEISHTGEF